jgi:hypothetical protein
MILVFLPLAFAACKGGNKQVSREEIVSVKELVAQFPEIKMPFAAADTSLKTAKNDSNFISYKTFAGLLPDSIFHSVFGKNGKPRIYPVGRSTDKNKETYLVAKAVSPAARALYVLVLSDAKQLLAAMPLLVGDDNDNTEQSVLIDNRYSISLNRQRKLPDGRTIYKKTAWAYISGSNAFALILTETNETETKHELQNPIDTLARKHKLSGDYVQDKMNLVSIRDGRNEKELRIFVHFEKDNGTCKGELKGEAKLTAPNKAVYHPSGDPCELTLHFEGNKVTLSEEGCGSHRDIKCFFDGTFTRKPPAKKAKANTGNKSAAKSK